MYTYMSFKNWQLLNEEQPSKQIHIHNAKNHLKHVWNMFKVNNDKKQQSDITKVDLEQSQVPS